MTAPDETSLRTAFLAVSTATLTTALFKRGFRNTFMQDVHPLNPATCRMAGPAYTLRLIPAREDLDHLAVYEDPRHPQRHAVETMPAGQVLVIDSRRDAHAASAGGILAMRLKVRGVAGMVTDGGFRDSPEIAAMDFPAYHQRPSAPTSLIHHHAADTGLPVGCGGVAVFPGDWIVGDAEGVVVVPAGIAAAVAAEAAAMTEFESFVEREVAGGRPTVGLYPPNAATRAEYEAYRLGKPKA